MFGQKKSLFAKFTYITTTKNLVFIFDKEYIFCHFPQSYLFLCSTPLKKLFLGNFYLAMSVFL
jgi:hypothetical protein